MEKQYSVEQLEKDLKKYPVTLDLDQVAEILGVSRKTVDGMKDKIGAFALDPDKERKQYRVTKASLIAFMLNNLISEGKK